MTLHEKLIASARPIIPFASAELEPNLAEFGQTHSAGIAPRLGDIGPNLAELAQNLVDWSAGPKFGRNRRNEVEIVNTKAPHLVENGQDLSKSA